MKNLQVLLLAAGLMIPCSTSFFLISAPQKMMRKSKMTDNTHQATQNTTGGLNSQTVNSAGSTIRTRTSSNSDGNHAAITTGTRGTVASSRSGLGTGQHTVTNTADTKTHTFENIHIAALNHRQDQQQPQAPQEQGRGMSLQNKMRSSNKNKQQGSISGGSGGSSMFAMTKLGAYKKSATSSKSAEMSEMGTEALGLKAAQTAQQDASSSSGSGSSSSNTAQDQFFAAQTAMMEGTGPQVASNTTPAKPAASASSAPVATPSLAPVAAPVPTAVA